MFIVRYISYTRSRPIGKKAGLHNRQALNSIGNLKDTYLSNFFKRIAYRKGRTRTVPTTARKLAAVNLNMMVKDVPYLPPTEYLFLDQKRKLRLVAKLKKNIAKLELNQKIKVFLILFPAN